MNSVQNLNRNGEIIKSGEHIKFSYIVKDRNCLNLVKNNKLVEEKKYK